MCKRYVGGAWRREAYGVKSCGEFGLESEPILHEGYEVGFGPKVVEGVVSDAPCI